MQRRQFLVRSLAASTAVGLSTWSAKQAGAQDGSDRECYELRTYQTETAADQKLMLAYLANGLVPALNRLGIDRIGVFTEIDGENKNPSLAITTLIPYTSVTQFLGQRAALADDQAYQQDAKDYLARPKNTPAFARINSRLLMAFAGMPVIEQPEYSRKHQPRIFELRSYQSHNEDMAARKVEMFNSGEIQLMRDVHMGPMLYGEVLIGDNVPCLSYMLSAPDLEAHRQHWKAFIDSPEWKRLKGIERYKGTVSHIDNWFLKPAECSQI